MAQARFNTCVSDVIHKVPPALYFGSFTPDVRPQDKFNKRITTVTCSACETKETPEGPVTLPKSQPGKRLFAPSASSLFSLTHTGDTRSLLPTKARFFD